jgi:anaerobic magnesium-protoporphyrin IX monomethyl ester cyclase
VLNELEELISRYGIKDVTFYDEIFALSRKNALKICEGIIEKKLDLTWAANARPQRLDAELLGTMKRAGCWRLLFGVESGSQKVLDIMKKGIKIDEIEEAVRLTRKFGIEAHGTFIFGTPGETFPEGLKTIRFARKLRLDYAAFGSLAPLPGTEVYQMINDPGKNDFSLHTMFNISYVPETMTRGELEKLFISGFPTS